MRPNIFTEGRKVAEYYSCVEPVVAITYCREVLRSVEYSSRKSS